MADRVRLGIIGTSGWAEMLYFNTLRGYDDVELVAIAGRNEARLAELAERFAVKGTHRDYRELIGRDDLDAVAVVLPDDLHKAATLAVIERGLDVLCEKPLANSAGDARQMLDAARSAGISHMVLFTWRWQPHFQYVKSLLDAGTFGRLYRLQMSFITNFAHDGRYQWRLDPARANGVLGDLGSHLFDLLRWLTGEEIAGVSADLGTAVPRSGIAGHETGSNNDFAHVTCRFAGGAQGTVDVTNVSHDGDRIVQHLLRIEGDKGALELDHVLFGAGAALRLKSFKAGGETVELTVPAAFYGAANPTDALSIYSAAPVGVRGFVSDIRAGRKPAPDFEDGWRAQQLVDAALRSNAERRWIEVGA